LTVSDYYAKRDIINLEEAAMPCVDAPKSPLVGKLRGIHLFHFEGAPCAQRVRFALAEKGLRRGREVPWASDDPATLVAEPGTWTSRHVSLIKKDHLSDAYAAIHPHMVVPALVHDGRLYVESMDIVDYVDAAWPEPPLMPAEPDRARLARTLIEDAKRLHVAVRYVSFRWGLGRLGRLDHDSEARLARLEPADSPERMGDFYRRYDRGAIDEATYDAHLTALEGGYADLERLLASDARPFLTGPAFSAADVVWSLKVLRIHECGYPFGRRFPAVAAWFARVTARPAFQEGVMGRHRTMSRAFRAKAAIENVLGLGIRRKLASRRAPAAPARAS
jgi:glutathione S-transferase